MGRLKFNSWCKVLTSICIIVLSSCKSISYPKFLHANLTAFGHKNSAHFTGVMVVDPEASDTLVKYHHNNYFVPASTAKIFTLYAALQLLPPKIPALRYRLSTDTLFIKGTGDPSFLNPNIADSTALNFLKKFNTIGLLQNNYEGDKFMPGWAWEDYQYYFSPELNPLPLFGNVVEIYQDDSLIVHPKYFRNDTAIEDGRPLRLENSNTFFVSGGLRDTIQVPYITSEDLTISLLKNVLDRDVFKAESDFTPSQTLFGMETDSILKQMLWESDNFVAEQLMLVASSTLSDTLSFTKARNHIFKTTLEGLPQEPRWVDGSGLSRYNLFTPESMVFVLDKLRKQLPEKRLFSLFPAWNANGTQKKPKKEENHFIFAKSGSMGNVYNLCGYLQTKKGNTLIFGFMNNNFRNPSREIRMYMYKVLHQIHEKY